MKKILPLIFILCMSHIAEAQFKFQHLLGGPADERGQTLFETFDHYYIFNGATLSYGQGSADAMLIKTAPDGQIIWSRVYGTAAYDNSEFALEAPDHGYVSAGRSNLIVASPSTAAVIFKTDSSGALQWSKSFGGSANDGFVQAINTRDSGFAFIGSTNSAGSGGGDVLLVHTDANGDTLFTRIYGTAKNEQGLSITQAPDSGYVICGRQIYTVDSSGTSDGLVIRTDKSGNILWEHQYGDTLWEEFESVNVLPDGNILIAGATTSFGAGNYDILMVMLDGNGVALWAKSYGGVQIDASYNALVNSDSTFVLSGNTNSFGYGHAARGDDSTNIFLLKTDIDGNVIWMQTYGDGLQDEAYRSAKASDGGYMVSGFTTDYTPGNLTQMLFIKTDSSGMTGCHEEFVTPIVNSEAMAMRDSALFTNSGIVFSPLTLTELAVNPFNDDACLFSGINSHAIKSSSGVFPDPFTNEINIVSDQFLSGMVYITISDMQGKILIKKQFNAADRFTIPSAQLPEGIYLLSVRNQLNSFIAKIIKD